MGDSRDDSPSEKDLVIGTSASRVLVTIKPDGRLIYGPDYTPDEAAAVFWDALARRRAQVEVLGTAEHPVHEARELFLEWEQALLQAGYADMANQVAAQRMNEMVGTAQAVQARLEASKADKALHNAAYKLIELGRAHALRKAGIPNEFETPELPPDPSKVLN
jgi:hypothetical protein